MTVHGTGFEHTPMTRAIRNRKIRHDQPNLPIRHHDPMVDRLHLLSRLVLITFLVLHLGNHTLGPRLARQLEHDIRVARIGVEIVDELGDRVAQVQPGTLSVREVEAQHAVSLAALGGVDTHPEVIDEDRWKRGNWPGAKRSV